MNRDIWTLLNEWQIPVIPGITASTVQAALGAAKQLGFPVAMKILSPDISHKSDVGGIILNIGDESQVEAAYAALMETVGQRVPDARIEGVLLQKMAGPGIEVIVGAKLDPQFGHVIMFGLGGIFVEIYRDVSFRVTPVDARMAREMILEIKSSPILQGARGREPVDLDAIADVILKVSGMVGQNPDIRELDINPLMVCSRGAVAVDARLLAD